MIRGKTIKAEENFPISGQGYTNGKLLTNKSHVKHLL